MAWENLENRPENWLKIVRKLRIFRIFRDFRSGISGFSGKSGPESPGFPDFPEFPAKALRNLRNLRILRHGPIRERPDLGGNLRGSFSRPQAGNRNFPIDNS